jgi:dihydrofolate reductase (trimethoprim resistance protein)
MFLIAAKSENNVIGSGLEIPWRVKGEQRLFRDITSHNTLVMGRKTFESIGRPLPNRDTVIITRQHGLKIAGCQTASSLEAALDLAMELRGEVFVAGGGEIYKQAIDQAKGIHLTTIHTQVDGDIYFPEFDRQQFTVVDTRFFESNINYTYEMLVRKQVETEK